MKHMHQGFSLTELLVCFFLSMLLIAILLQHVLSVSRTHQHIHDVLDEATELQWVFDVMRARIHHAGFTPCLGLNQLQTTDTRDSSESLQAIEVQAGTHLLIRKMDEAHFGLARRLTPDTLRVRDFGLKPDRPVIIADCVHAEVHDVESFYHTSEGLLIQLKTPLVFDYSSEIYFYAWIGYLTLERNIIFRQGLACDAHPKFWHDITDHNPCFRFIVCHAFFHAASHVVTE